MGVDTVRLRRRLGRGVMEKLAAQGQLLFSQTVSQKAIVTDADETFREDMQQELSHELNRREGHRAVTIAVSVVFVGDGDWRWRPGAYSEPDGPDVELLSGP